MPLLAPAFAFALPAALASTPAELRAAAAAPPTDLVQPASPPAESGFTFLGLLQTRAISTNVVPTSPFLDGQVIGRLGGTNLTTVLPPAGLDLDGDGEEDEDQGNAAFVEQRFSGFFTYAPPALDQRVGVTAGLEIDFLWGDQSYGTAGNTGGGIGGDMVNLQTRRLHFNYRPRVGPKHELEVVTGLQFISDTVHNAAKAAPDDLFRTGGGIRFWGTEAAGVTVYGRHHDARGDVLRYKLGTYTLIENGSALTDDAALHMVDFAVHPAWNLWVGGHAWLLNDYTHGRSGTFGVGLSSPLSELQGGPKLDFIPEGEDANPDIDAQIAWLAADLAYNHRLDRGPLGATALLAANLGKLYITGQPDVDVRGWLVDGELRLRWAPGAGSVLRVSGLASSRDGTGPDAYTGLVTGNQYGIVGAVYATSGCLLLFPDPLSINRMAPIVYDLSNRGQGLVGATFGAGYDPIPHRLTVQVGGGWAQDGLGAPMGTELNARLVGKPWLFSNLSLAAARVFGSEAPQADGRPLPADPWTVILSMDNLLF